MKRALVSCASLAILAVSACSSDSHPVITPLQPMLDAGLLEIGPTWISTGGDATGGSKDKDAPLVADGLPAGIDGAPPSKVTVFIVDPAPVADGGQGPLPVFGTTARLAPKVRVEVQSLTGDSAGDLVVSATANLIAEGSTTVVSTASLNQTQYEVIPESGTRIYAYGDAPLDVTKLTTGSYTLEVAALTAGGATGTAKTSVFIDGGPVITFLQPDDKTFVRGSLVASVIVIDQRVGVKSVEFSVGQVQIPATAIVASGSQYALTVDFGSFNPPLDGLQVLRVTATNQNGVVSQKTRQFTVDNDGPVIDGKPGQDELIGKLITITATVTDPGSGVDENSVVAVVAHGDAKFEIRLSKGTGTAYTGLFDTTQLPTYSLFPSISFRAQDMLGNQSSVGHLLSLDNTPPIMELDPFDAVVAVKEATGKCSWPWDPVGPDAIDDGSVVSQLFDIRARIEDEGNTPLAGDADYIPVAKVDPTSVKVLILDDTSLPLVVDTSDPPDGICDDINPEIAPSVAPQSSKEAQLIDLKPMGAKIGSPDFSIQPGVACSDAASPPRPLCYTTYNADKDRSMTYAMGYLTNEPSIWTVPPIVADDLQCAGRQFDASNNLRDGWACVAVEARDKVGNKQVSPPIRICVAAKPDSTGCTSPPPDCTGTVVKATSGALATVDSTKPCKPWRLFPKGEVIVLK